MKPRILVIDDDYVILMEMQNLFAKNGFDTKIAIDSFEAKELISHEYFDIVYTDMRMPGLDGADVCKIVKRLSPDTAVIIFSGSPSAMVNRQAEFLANGGIDMYLRKPVSNDDLLAATEKALKQRKKHKPLHN